MEQPVAGRTATYEASFPLAGKCALVTGASSGLGRHFAVTLAAAGAAVAVGARRLDRLQALAAEIGAAGGVAHPIVLDVTDATSVVTAFDEAEAALGPLDILINNAGVPSGSWFADTTDEEWRRVLDVNLDGVFRVGREAAKRMIDRRAGGAIVNIASVLGLGVLKTVAPYATSKAAVIQLTKTMALELARHRIRVNALAPGYIETELNADYLSSDAGLRMIARVPLGRAGQLGDLDGPLLLLVSDAGRYMTGSVIVVDGGQTLAIG
jgi:NAD(P)-dependent dehydrogenase (short-subunit alcohol dehydrogenase family)